MVVKVMNPFILIYLPCWVSHKYCWKIHHTRLYDIASKYIFPLIKITIVIVIHHSSTSRKNSFLSPCISPPRVDVTRTRRRVDKEDCIFCVSADVEIKKEVSPCFFAVYKRWMTQDLLQPETILRCGGVSFSYIEKLLQFVENCIAQAIN